MIAPLEYSDDITPCNLQLATSILPCDRYHHYYHYQSSAQYLWLARTLVAFNKKEEAAIAYKNALFQDHFNEEAMVKDSQDTSPPAYDKHPFFDGDFCTSIGKAPTTETARHDEAALLYKQGNFKQVLSLLDPDAAHSNSQFLIGRCWFLLGEYKKAHEHITEAIRLSHIAHDAYHRAASHEHLLRGQKFLADGDLDFAISDFTKALDLYRHNKEARQARALAYRKKGNEKLALQDEQAAA